MKIYNKIVIDMTTNEVIEEDSYTYDGDVAMCDTNVSAPKAPAKSPAQQEIEQEQLEILREQRQQQSEFQPFLYKSMGLTRDPQTGELVESPTEQTEIERLYEERQLAALKGELPVSPALESELGTQEKQVQEDLARRLGPEWQRTTAGQQSMGEFQKRAGLLREEARRGQLTTGEGLMASRMGQISDIEQRRMANLQGAGQSAFQLLGAQGGVLAPYQSERMMGWQMANQAAQQSAANKAGLISNAFGAAGTVAGMGLTGGLSGLKGAGAAGGGVGRDLTPWGGYGLR